MDKFAASAFIKQHSLLLFHIQRFHLPEIFFIWKYSCIGFHCKSCSYQPLLHVSHSAVQTEQHVHRTNWRSDVPQVHTQFSATANGATSSHQFCTAPFLLAFSKSEKACSNCFLNKPAFILLQFLLFCHTPLSKTTEFTIQVFCFISPRNEKHQFGSEVTFFSSFKTWKTNNSWFSSFSHESYYTTSWIYQPNKCSTPTHGMAAA